MDVQHKKEQLVNQLLAYFGNDTTRLMKMSGGLKALGIDVNQNHILDSIAANPEHFLTILTYADLGILEKLTESVNIIKGVK